MKLQTQDRPSQSVANDAGLPNWLRNTSYDYKYRRSGRSVNQIVRRKDPECRTQMTAADAMCRIGPEARRGGFCGGSEPDRAINNG